MIEPLKLTDLGSFEEFATMEMSRLLEALRIASERIKLLTSGPGGIMEMKQTIADKEQRIEKLENQFKLYFHAFNKAASHIEKLEAALEGKEPLEWTENYGQGSEPWLEDTK